MRRLLAHRDARLYLGGQVVSLFGDSCMWLAMGIWVKTLTHSNAQAGLVFFFFTAPSLLGPVSGLVVDRLRRRPVLITTNALSGAAVLVVLLVHGAGQVWLIDAVMFAYGVSYSVLGPAQSALLTVVVPGDLLPAANGAFRTAQESLRLIGPLAGAGLFVAVGGHVIAIIDAATFAVPIVSLLALHVEEPPPRPSAGRWRTQTVAGLRHVWHTIELRHVVVAGACATSVFGFAETITYAVAGNGLHRPAAFVGVLVAIQGVGGVAGGLTAAPLIRRIGEGRLMGTALLVLAAGATLEIPPVLAPVIGGAILIGISIPWLVVGLITLTQRLTPAELQGRVYSAVDTLITSPQPVSIAVGAGLIGVAGYRPLLAAMATVATLSAVYLISRPEQRHARRSHAISTPAPVPVEKRHD
jgi:MFS family permease